MSRTAQDPPDRDDPVLVVNIGNTNTTAALCARGRVLRRAVLPTGGATARAVARALGAVCAAAPPAGAILGSTVPGALPPWRRALRAAGLPAPLTADARLELGVRLAYPLPETLGADRLADVCGGAACYGTPVIVCDFGTAATFNAVLRDRGFVGGVIAPGPALMLDYLAERTARLPAVAWRGAARPAGRSTAEAMRIGAAVGYPGMVRAILENLRRLPGLAAAPVVATGGGARRALRGMEHGVVVDPDLTLVGLARMWELHRGAGARRGRAALRGRSARRPPAR